MKQRFSSQLIQTLPNGNISQYKHKNARRGISMISSTHRMMVLSFIFTLIFLLHKLRSSSSMKLRTSSSYHNQVASYTSQIQNLTTKNLFIETFQRLLFTDYLLTPVFESDHPFFVPLILDNGKLLCRAGHRKRLSWYRTRFFTQMVRSGLTQWNLHQQQQRNVSSMIHSQDVVGGLPIIVMDVDGNGCNVAEHRDDFSFPRLTWSIPSQKYGENWCNVIGMPSYETWMYCHRTHETDIDWIGTFESNEADYPWSTKLAKAVWRGSTTYEASQYADKEIHEIPRGILVQKSKEYPELIDAGFHRINQKFESQAKELREKTIVSRRMPSRDMMKYKAIIDIDGNNWSSRFGMLLCSNSVIIKIDPDFIEYFYDELFPMVHYIPASLDNVTEVVKYVMDENNEIQMKAIVKSANQWCKDTLSAEGLASASLTQLETYKKRLDEYIPTWKTDWMNAKNIFDSTVNDLVECNAWSFIDFFANPRFAGL